jgi:hypothetical protein
MRVADSFRTETARAVVQQGTTASRLHRTGCEVDPVCKPTRNKSAILIRGFWGDAWPQAPPLPPTGPVRASRTVRLGGLLRAVSQRPWANPGSFSGDVTVNVLSTVRASRASRNGDDPDRNEANVGSSWCLHDAVGRGPGGRTERRAAAEPPHDVAHDPLRPENVRFRPKSFRNAQQSEREDG